MAFEFDIDSMPSTGVVWCWKVLEIDNAIFQDLQCYGKMKIFKMTMEKFWIFVLESFEIS